MSQRFPWWPDRKADQVVWLYNCLAVWPTLGPTMGFTNAQVAALSQLLLEMVTVLNEVDQCQFAMKAVNEWRDDVFYGPANNKPAPPSPTITTPATPTIDSGFFEQLKSWRMQVIVSPNFNTAIGEALGFLGQQKQSLNPELAVPQFSVTTATDYWVNFKGSLQGFDSVNVEYQRKGTGTWENVGYLNKTPGGLQISPATPGTAEIGLVRCRFVQKNQTIGSYSPNYSVTIS